MCQEVSFKISWPCKVYEIREIYIRWRDWTTKNKCPFLLTFKCFYYSGWQKAVWPKRRPFCPIPVHPSLPAAAAGRSHVSYGIFISCPNDDGRLCSCEGARWWNVPRRLKKKKKRKNRQLHPVHPVTPTEDTRRMWAVRGRRRGLTAIRHLPRHRVAARPLEWGSSPESYVTVREIGPTTESCWWKGLCGGWR